MESLLHLSPEEAKVEGLKRGNPNYCQVAPPEYPQKVFSQTSRIEMLSKPLSDFCNRELMTDVKKQNLIEQSIQYYNTLRREPRHRFEHLPDIPMPGIKIISSMGLISGNGVGKYGEGDQLPLMPERGQVVVMEHGKVPFAKPESNLLSSRRVLDFPYQSIRNGRRNRIKKQNFLAT